MALESFEIPFSADSNLPDLNRIKLVDVCDVLYVNEPDIFLSVDTVGHVLPNRALSLKNGAVLSRIWFLPGQGSYTEELVQTEHGEVWKGMLSIKTSGDSAGAREVVERMAGRKFLVFLMDNDSKLRLLGGVDSPAVFGVAFGTAGWKGRTLSFSCMMRKQAYYLNTWEESELFGVDFSDEFSDDFMTAEFASFTPE